MTDRCGSLHTAIIEGIVNEFYDRTNKYPNRDGILPLESDFKPKLDALAPSATYRARNYGRIIIVTKIDHLLVVSIPPRLSEKFQYHKPDLLERVLALLEQETI